MSKRLHFMAVLFPALAAAQPFLNLDFEVSTRARLRSWGFGSPGYELSIDTAEFVSGKQSLRIRNLSAPDSGLGVSTQLLPLELVRGRKVRYSGSIKTDGVTPGYGALWLRVDGVSGFITLDNMFQNGPRGTTSWTRYEIEREISSQGVQVVFGVFLQGRGTAWFDDLRIEIDGVPLPQTEPFIGEPSPEQLDWLRSNTIPFRTPDAGSGFEDLQAVKPLIGAARIVGLGEATHGTSEFFRMKHRLVEFLASEMGFTVFSIEANMPEAYRVNDYVLAGRGDPKELLKGMYFWTWNTQEVLDMIEWMRRFNASGRGRIQFTGFDMQTWTVAGSIVRMFIEKAEPEYLATVDQAYQKIRETRPLPVNPQNMPKLYEAAEAAHSVREHLESHFQEYVSRLPLAEADWAIQNARVAEMAAFSPLGGSLHRDAMMALNVKWLLDQNPGAKAALWAHNYHVSRTAGAQGSYIAGWYQSDYVVLGFAFHEGQYNAVSQTASGALGPLRANDATVSYPGSVEYIFHRTDMPRFILDLRRAGPQNAGAWLLGEMEFREIGAVAVDGFAVRRSLRSDYDALIFFDRSTPSALLPF